LLQKLAPLAWLLASAAAISRTMAVKFSSFEAWNCGTVFFSRT
jgi:hypothetical protein